MKNFLLLYLVWATCTLCLSFLWREIGYRTGYATCLGEQDDDKK